MDDTLALPTPSSLDEAVEVVLGSFAGDAPVSIRILQPGEDERGTGCERGTAVDPDVPRVWVTAGCGARVGVVAGSDVTASAAAMTLAALVDRMDAERRCDAAHSQLAATEQLGGLGSYDWDMVENRLTWSDGLFRIYGEEPGSLEPTYERFIERVVADDRARVEAVHEHAVRTAGEFTTEERVVRADGEVRTLLTNGVVRTDDVGTPVRMYGVCRDVTDERAAHARARQVSKRFEELIEAAPDGIVVVRADGSIAAVNPQAEALFGYDAGTLVGMSVDELVPGSSRMEHARLREGFTAAPSARPMAAGADLRALRADGSLVPVDIALAPLAGEGAGFTAAFVRDATIRREAERDRRRIAEGDIRRRQALELNDNVVQGLVGLLWELDDHTVPDGARRSAERTLAAAQRMMSDLVDALPAGHGLVRATLIEGPGVDVRGADSGHVENPGADSQSADSQSVDSESVDSGHVASHGVAHPSADTSGTGPGTSPAPRPVRVVVADDAAELRLVLRMRLDRLDGIVVVDTAEDGQQAVAACTRHQPDVVLLDLAMPRLDGLEAARSIRDLLPATRIFVLSGYPSEVMLERVRASGADAYFQKTGDLAEVFEAVQALAPAVDGRTGDR